MMCWIGSYLAMSSMKNQSIDETFYFDLKLLKEEYIYSNIIDTFKNVHG